MPPMTAEVRDLVLLAAVLLLALGFYVQSRRPPPPARAVDEQFRDIRHRVGSVEQQATRLPDHEARLRRIEGEVGEVRGSLANLKEGQQRIERHLNMLVEHQITREGGR